MSELWDDSALIKAFNSARAKYKDMHGSIGTSKSDGQKTYHGDTEIVSLECKNSMVDTSDQEKLEEDVLLQEAEAPEMESLEVSEQKHDAPLVENTVDKTCTYGNEGHPSSLHQASTRYTTERRAQDRQQILSQLQQLAEQQQKLEQQLAYVGNTTLEGATTSAAWNSYSGSQYCSGVQQQAYPAVADYCHTCVGNTNLEGATTSAAWNSYSSSQYCSGVQQQAYPAVADYCHTCVPCYWNGYYNAVGTFSSLPSAPSWSNELKCKHCSRLSNSFLNDHHETTDKPSGTSECASSSQKLPDTSTLPEMVRVAVVEAMKASDAQKHTPEMNQSLHPDLSDVAVAWFLAGFHTSRFLSRGGESQ